MEEHASELLGPTVTICKVTEVIYAEAESQAKPKGPPVFAACSLLPSFISRHCADPNAGSGQVGNNLPGKRSLVPSTWSIFGPQK